LNSLRSIEAAQKLKQPIKNEWLLADFRDHHASAMYQKLFSAKTVSEFKEAAILAVSNYPFYIAKKAINRLSFNRLNPYLCRIELALILIQTYGLNWTPISISL